MKTNTQNITALGDVTCSVQAMKEFSEITQRNASIKVDDPIILNSLVYKEIMSANSLTVPKKGGVKDLGKILLAKIIGEKSQVEKLDFSNHHLNIMNKSLGGEIFQALSFSKTLKALNLSGNFLSKGREGISKLKNLAKLEFLDLSNNGYELDQIQAIFGIIFAGTKTKIKIFEKTLTDIEKETLIFSYGGTTLNNELEQNLALPKDLVNLVGDYCEHSPQLIMD